MLSKKSNPLRPFLGFVAIATLLSLCFWAIINRQYIIDTITVLQFQPSQDVSSITRAITLTDTGKFVFYSGQPMINDESTFNQNCKRQEPKSAILGCYADGKIFVFDVQNDELKGIEEVTAAHELLHGVWERLGASEKKTLGAQLEAAYSKIDNSELKQRMDYYDRTEPGERQNELHSILGTEFANLGPELEGHYAKYFSDRTTVTSLYSGYQSVFDRLSSASDTLYRQISIDGPSIENDTQFYNQEVVSINTVIPELQQRAQGLDRTNARAVNQYNSERSVLLARVDAVNALRERLAARSVAYNQKVAEYNALVIRSNQLTQSLDSTIQPAPTL